MSMLKRAYDFLLAAIGLLLVWPLLAGIALAIRLFDGSPVLFRQARIGWRGCPFQILKFRTMSPGSEACGTSVTGGGDLRVTRIGKFLRRTKLDELPQLWNVLTGSMSFVGPRPEVARFVAFYTPEQRRVLELKPGITDLATLHYRNEEEVLRGAVDVERFYVETVMACKIHLNLKYATYANAWEDTKVILRTLLPGVPLHLRAELEANSGTAVWEPKAPEYAALQKRDV